MGVVFNDEQGRIADALRFVMGNYRFEIVWTAPPSHDGPPKPADLDYVAEKLQRYGVECPAISRPA